MKQCTVTAFLAAVIILALANGARAQGTNFGVIGITSGQTSRNAANAQDSRTHATDPTEVSSPPEQSAAAANRKTLGLIGSAAYAKVDLTG